MGYRSADLRRVATPLTDFQSENTCCEHLGQGSGPTTVVGFRIGPDGWLHLNPDGRARYFIVFDGTVTFIDDAGALEIMERGSTFGSGPNWPLTLRTVPGCVLFMVETDDLEAPSADMDYRVERRRSEHRARSWWRRLVGQRSPTRS